MFTAARAHLREADEGYFQHLRFAALVGSMLFAAAIACLIHALVPALCRRSGSGIVRLVSELMIDRSLLKVSARAASGPLTLAALLLLCAVPAIMLIAAGMHPVALPLSLLLAGLPIAYLASNPDLDPVA